ncbi:MAG TPA: undecaprenyl/decaprenyl-phosphate alpha-N-acetylglucosaminyl 1-phosphate transferase, partial [Pedobacter sp.]
MLEYLNSHYVLCYFLVISSSICLSLINIPSIINVAKARNLYDDLGQFRKRHDHGIPRLGGIAIFVSFTITMLLFGIADKSLPVNYLLTACIMLFALGIKDDLYGINPATKFSIELIATLILVIPGNIRLSSMYGIFNIYDISYVPSVILTVL